MAGLGDRFVAAGVAAFEKGSTPVQRTLGVLMLIGLLMTLVFTYVTATLSEQVSASKYAGFSVCQGSARHECVQLVPGELESDGNSGAGGRSGSRQHNSVFVRSGESDGVSVLVRVRDAAKPVEGMLLDGEFVGVQDAAGQRYPVDETSAPQIYWMLLIASIMALLGSFVGLFVLHERN